MFAISTLATHYRFKLKVLIFIIFTFISAIPVALLSYWVQKTALEQEIAAVEEKHLIIAQNLSRAFERYASDTKSIFSYISSNYDSVKHHYNLDSLLMSMGISELCIIHQSGMIKNALTAQTPCSISLSASNTDNLWQTAGNSTQISNLQRLNDRPIFFLSHIVDSQRLAIGTLETDYLVSLQKSIAFGERGHSMVVDAVGRVIAHPDPQWERISKDASKLSVVQKMMQGKTGVSTFYSPPMQADMIAGHTSVPDVGWGVMVPQPFNELRNHATHISWASLLIAIIGLSIAALLSWFCARALTQSLEEINKTTKAIAHGDESARVKDMSHYTAREVKDLAASFNQMVNQLSQSKQQLQQHKDSLEQTVHERTDELQQQKERLDITLASIGDGVITTDSQGRIVYLNPAAEKLSGWSLKEAKGRPLSEVLPIVDAQTTQAIALRAQSYPDISQTYDGLLVKRDGSTVDIQQSVAAIKSSLGGQVIILRDVTETHKLSQQLSYEASHDSLTGLLNRRAFEERVNYAIDNIQSEQCVHSLCYLDLDQFKIINDTSGHAAGDQMLCAVAHILKASMRKADIVARLGGDEFGILLAQCSTRKAQKITENICQQIKDMRFAYDNQVFHVGVSIGIAEINSKNDTLIHIFKAADSACYMAKEQGRGRVHIYQPSGEAVLEKEGEIRWVNRLHRALEDDLFELYVQPIVSLNVDEDRPSHHEILLRMINHESGQLINPDQFLPAAARYNLLPNIDQWVFSHATDWLCDNWQYLNGGRLSINISGATLSDATFLKFARKKLNQNKMNADSIIIEITENSALSNLPSALKFILAMKKIGCQFALDDFGKGFSSLSILKQLPIDYIKIDGSFVKDILNDPVDEAMVQTICTIGHTMGKKVVAEFVESEEIISRLQELNIDFAQGFAIAKPSPLSQFIT